MDKITKTRSRYASLAAVLSVQARVKVVWQATTVQARLGAKDRRLLNVFLYFIPTFQSAADCERVLQLLLACFHNIFPANTHFLLQDADV